MNKTPDWLLPTDTPLRLTVSTEAGRLQLSEERLTLSLMRPWQGPDPLHAFASWLSDTQADGIQLDGDTSTVSFAVDTARPLLSAHRAHVMAWWLTQVSAGMEQWAAFGAMASVWGSVGIPTMDAIAFVDNVGLVGWKATGSFSALIFLRPLHATTPMPLLRLVLQDADGASADRLACRFDASAACDEALDLALELAAFGAKSYIVAEGTAPAKIAEGVRHVEWLAENAASLADILGSAQESALADVAQVAQAESPATPANTLLPPATATVIPRQTPEAAPAAEPATTNEPEANQPEANQPEANQPEESSTPADTDSPESDETSESPVKGLEFERPRVEVPVPETAPALPDADSPDVFDLFLEKPSSNNQRTVELLTRVLKMTAEEAQAACVVAPVKIAGGIAAWEVRKLDAVIRLGGGGTLRWDKVSGA
jgi:hypothetical protein